MGFRDRSKEDTQSRTSEWQWQQDASGAVSRTLAILCLDRGQNGPQILSEPKLTRAVDGLSHGRGKGSEWLITQTSGVAGSV